MNRSRLVAIGLAALCLGATPACGDDGTDGTGSFERTTDVDRAAATAAAVDVRADGCGPRRGFGSGSVVETADGERLVITAAHVIAGTTSIQVVDVEGRTTTAVPVLFDPDLDVAVIAPAEPIGTPAPVRGDGARADERGVVVLPRVVDGAVTVRTVEVRVVRPVDIATTDIHLERDVVRPGFELQATIERGDSGALVVLPGGAVGVIWARSNQTEGRAWASDLPPTVRDLLAGAGPSGSDWATVDVGRCVSR